jgi:hypothetical protein
MTRRIYFKQNKECDSNILSVPKSDAIVHSSDQDFSTSQNGPLKNGRFNGCCGSFGLSTGLSNHPFLAKSSQPGGQPKKKPVVYQAPAQRSDERALAGVIWPRRVSS